MIGKTLNNKNRNIKPGTFPPAGGNLRQKIHFWISAAIMLVIFFHSAMPADLSSQESGVIVAFLMKHMKALFGEDPEMVSFIVRKSAHFLEYAVLGFSLCLTVDDYAEIYEENKSDDAAESGEENKIAGTAASGEENRSNGTAAPGKQALRRMIIPWLTGTVYAATDEFHQMFVPGRSCELRDIMIDSCGVAAGTLLCCIIKKRKMRQPN